MTCCVIGRHPDAADIDRAIRAQQAAARANESTRAPSYSQIARTYGLRKATLLDHRDRCLAAEADRGTDRSGVPVRSEGVPGCTAAATGDENTNDFARYERYGAGVPAWGDGGADAGGGRATGPPESANRTAYGTGARAPSSAGTDRALIDGANHALDAGTTDAVAGTNRASLEVTPAPPPTVHRTEHRARARSVGAVSSARHWDALRETSVATAEERLTNAVLDSEITDPNARAHGTYIQEIVEIIGRDAWENDATVTRLARAWDKSKMFVIGCYRDACALRRMARGSPNEDREVSLVRWVNLYKLAVANGDALSLKVASDALKGYDAAAGIVDKSTRVQVNIAQSDEAKMFVQIFLDEAKGDPALLERIRRRLAEARDKLGDPTPILTTGAEVDAAE